MAKSKTKRNLAAELHSSEPPATQDSNANALALVSADTSEANTTLALVSAAPPGLPPPQASPSTSPAPKKAWPDLLVLAYRPRSVIPKPLNFSRWLALTTDEIAQIITDHAEQRTLFLPEPDTVVNYDSWQQLLQTPLDYQRLVVMCSYWQRSKGGITAAMWKGVEPPPPKTCYATRADVETIVETAVAKMVTPLVATLQEVAAKVTALDASTAQLAEKATSPPASPEESSLPARTFADILKTELKAEFHAHQQEADQRQREAAEREKRGFRNILKRFTSSTLTAELKQQLLSRMGLQGKATLTGRRLPRPQGTGAPPLVLLSFRSLADRALFLSRRT
eukprot:jgi/Mesvir1/3934/Mv19873-RA.1